jgi:hypothetical protein
MSCTAYYLTSQLGCFAFTFHFVFRLPHLRWSEFNAEVIWVRNPCSHFSVNGLVVRRMKALFLVTIWLIQGHREVYVIQ